jgi:ribose 5-phosphate isomerase RpiB
MLSAAWRCAAAALEPPSLRTKYQVCDPGSFYDVFSARQDVEDDDMNVFCLGGKVTGSALTIDLIEIF